MFEPQATPYADPFSPYGIGAPSFSTFQPTSGAGGGGGGHGLVVDSGGVPTQFRETLFSPVVASNANVGAARPHFNNSSSYDTNTPHQRYNKMAGHDREAQELAAIEFEREEKCPIPVGTKQSSRAIAEDYANADPVYVAKTAALPLKYSHYRPIAGDGNCGWWAIGFSYFESLLRLQSKARLYEELARILSLNQLIQQNTAYDPDQTKEFTEETLKLLKDLGDEVETSLESAIALLENQFNKKDVSQYIIFHFRLLASAWLASNDKIYISFIPENIGGVEGYRAIWLESVNTEIDHLGMTILVDVLLKPLGIAVEIVYLDRTEGSHANSHILESLDSNGNPINPDGPMIHLLYRPSHYDILYKDVPSLSEQQVSNDAARSSNIQVNRATNFSHQHNIQNTTPSMADFSQLDLDTLLSIPGFAMPPQSTPLSFQPQYQTSIDQSYSHSPMSASLSPISPGASVATPSSSTGLPQSFPPQQQPQQQTLASPNAIVSPHGVQTFAGPATQLPLQARLPNPGANHRRPSLTSHPSLSSELSSPTSATSSFRPSKYEYTAAAEWQEPVVFQTSTFKNSHYNTAHYNNPNFQPEEWTPESEDAPVIRKKSSS